MQCAKCGTVLPPATAVGTATWLCQVCGTSNPPAGRDFKETTPITDQGPESTPLKERELRE